MLLAQNILDLDPAIIFFLHKNNVIFAFKLKLDPPSRTQGIDYLYFFHLMNTGYEIRTLAHYIGEVACLDRLTSVNALKDGPTVA